MKTTQQMLNSCTSMSNEKILIAETNVNQRAASTSQTKKVLILRASKNNSGDIWYGSSNIDGDNSDYLSPGEVRIFYFENPYNIYLRGIAGDILYCNALD